MNGLEVCGSWLFSNWDTIVHLNVCDCSNCISVSVLYPSCCLQSNAPDHIVIFWLLILQAFNSAIPSALLISTPPQQQPPPPPFLLSISFYFSLSSSPSSLPFSFKPFCCRLSLSSLTSARMLALARTTAPTSSPGLPPRTTAVPTHTAPSTLYTKTTKTTTRLLAASPSLNRWLLQAAPVPPLPPPCCIFRGRSRGTAAAP